MTMNNEVPVYFELGNYLEVLRHGIKVDNKFLTIDDLRTRVSISPNTYASIKGAFA